MRTPINSDGRSWHSSQQKMVQRAPSGKIELSFVDSICEMWKLRWLIFRSRSEMAADKVLKKFKHQWGDFIPTLEELMRPVNRYFLQYNNLLFK